MVYRNKLLFCQEKDLQAPALKYERTIPLSEDIKKTMQYIESKFMDFYTELIAWPTVMQDGRGN